MILFPYVLHGSTALLVTFFDDLLPIFIALVFLTFSFNLLLCYAFFILTSFSFISFQISPTNRKSSACNISVLV